jgi:hypothetical protein
MCCRMNVKNSTIKSHGCGLSNGADPSICQRRVAKIRHPKDEVLDSYSGFFLDFLTTCPATHAQRTHFLLRAGTFHSYQQVVSSKSLVPLILCYIFPLLFLTPLSILASPDSLLKKLLGILASPDSLLEKSSGISASPDSLPEKLSGNT